MKEKSGRRSGCGKGQGRCSGHPGAWDAGGGAPKRDTRELSPQTAAPASGPGGGEGAAFPGRSGRLPAGPALPRPPQVAGRRRGGRRGAARRPPAAGRDLPCPALPCPALPCRALAAPPGPLRARGEPRRGEPGSAAAGPPVTGLRARPPARRRPPHLGVVVQVPEVQAPHPVHAGEERGMHWRPHDIVDIVGIVFKGVERLVVL